MVNALTVDVEDWYQTNDFNFPTDRWGDFEDRVEVNTRRILDIFDEFALLGTFFVLGCVATRHPRLVRDIVDRGHELGSHGGWHRLLSQMSMEEIRKDALWSKSILEDISGQSVTSFRAPSWSIGRGNMEVLNVLEESGYLVDSSIQPFQTPLSGWRNVPRHPFHPMLGGRRLSIVEFPSTVARFGGANIPFSGGLYMRVLPARLVKRCLRQVNRKKPGMIYVHPWELDVHQPRISKSPLLLFTHYFRLRQTEPHLREVLRSFSFGPLRDVLHGHKFPVVNLQDEENHACSRTAF